jgi:hypothetical protein
MAVQLTVEDCVIQANAIHYTVCQRQQNNVVVRITKVLACYVTISNTVGKVEVSDV